MKEPYKWDYTIRIKTKSGEYTYEKESLDNIDLLLQKHPDYSGIEAQHIEEPKEKSKKLTKTLRPTK